MPVDWKKYPKNWKQISLQVREEAHQRCEFCGVENYTFYRNLADGKREKVEGMQLEAATLDGEKLTRIILTVAHLDHDTAHNDRTNLRALCQRCHNRHDVEFRKRNRAAGLSARKGLQSLFPSSAALVLTLDV